jgi:hypothetical protein
MHVALYYFLHSIALRGKEDREKMFFVQNRAREEDLEKGEEIEV